MLNIYNTNKQSYLSLINNSTINNSTKNYIDEQMMPDISGGSSLNINKSKNKKTDQKTDQKTDKKIKQKTKQLNGSKKSQVIKHKIMTNEEKNEMLKIYNEIVNNDNEKKCVSYPHNKIEKAISGIYIKKNERKNRIKKKNGIKELCYEIQEAHNENNEPFVHDDSLTAWGNDAVARYGLTIGDILNMKFGESMKVIMFDRNIGDYTHGNKKGYIYDPKKDGCTYATYIHGNDLTGILNMYDAGVIHAPFTWEINISALKGKSDIFWGPLDGCCDGWCDSYFDKKKGEKDKKPIRIQDLDPNIKVGWRGPSIRLSDAEKYLPDRVVHYDTWWDDYMPFKESDLTNYLVK